MTELTVTAAADQYCYSRQHLHRLLARYRAGGLDAVEPQSRRPRSNPRATEPAVREEIIDLRLRLTKDGLDAGPVTIAWHLTQPGHTLAGHTAPSTSTIRRILHDTGLITPEPRKRPKSSIRRFQAAQPNECWQSDFTHWHLADGTDIEILNWLDDHSRYLLACTVHQPVTGDDVVNQFLTATNTHGLPAATLTDNGRVYTARFGGGKNAFEYLLAALGITQKNGSPGHPQTQGKICEESAVVLHRARSDPGQGMTTVSFVRFVGRLRCSTVAAHRPDGSDLIGAWTRSPVTDLSPVRPVRPIRQISPNGGASPSMTTSNQPR